MPRAAKPEGIRILDYFRTAELGEAKVIVSLAAEEVQRRYQQAINKAGGNPTPAAKRQTRKVNASAQSTQSTSQEAVSNV